MSDPDRTPAQKAHPTYLALLALNPILLVVVGWFSIRTVNNFEDSVQNVAKEQAAMRVDMAGLRATMDAWAKQEFVHRSLFDALKSEMERRIEALEKKG